MVAYTTSKAAISGMTRVLARELGDAQHSRQRDRARRDSSPRARRRCGTRPKPSSEFLDQQCLKFRLSEDDVARTALFLASDEARGITGQNLIVDAGLAQTSVGT